MAGKQPLTILCLTSYEKGQEFMRACKELGARVFLVTVEKLRDGDWPRDSIEETFFVPTEIPIQDLIYSVSYIARSRPVDRIVALDEFDMENAAALREHLRVPGMGLTTVRYFRDKLAMRSRAQEGGILVPEFVHVLNYDKIRDYLERVKSPWLLKPRSQASGIGMRKIEKAEELWPWLDQLGDQQSSYLLEHFVPGDVYHVDSVVSERKVMFAEAHAYGKPPFETAHHGGVFTTRTLPRSSPESKSLLKINKDLIEALGLVRGVTHAEYLRAHDDGRFYFIEIAARVGGAYIADVIEASTGVNLWREWAKIEIGSGKEPYQLPEVHRDYAGVILSLARQAEPDTASYADPEIHLRLKKHHHAGFVLRSPKADRIQELLESYVLRFRDDFMATQPIPDKPTA
jgi:biotin carboxylase